MDNLDATGSIWLQLSKPGGGPCCRSFGTNIHPFEEYLQANNDWVMFLGPETLGETDVFGTVFMIHRSRFDGRTPVGAQLLLYDNCSQMSGEFQYDPVGFIESYCDIGLGMEEGSHVHILLQYPLAEEEEEEEDTCKGPRR